MEYAFLPIHGYRIYVLLFVIKIIVKLIGLSGKKTVSFKKTSYIVTHILLMVLITDVLCQLHNVFTTIGDNIKECKFRGVATVDLLLDRVDYPGWFFYVIMLVVILSLLMLESGRTIETKSKKNSFIMILVSLIAIVFANLLNSFSVYEYCGLECEGISSFLVESISGLIYGGDKYYLHYATNIVILLAIPLYITLVNCVCVPRLKAEEALKRLKQLKRLNDVALILFIAHFIRDTFFWLESYAYAPMVICSIVIKVYLRSELKKL